MGSDTNVLFTAFKIGNVEIKNRFVLSPMGFNQLYDSHGALNPAGIEFYAERAKGGFGLLYTGVMGTDTEVDRLNPDQFENPLNVPPRFINRASEMTERCGAYGTKVIAELYFGAGRNYPDCKAPSELGVFEYPDLRSPVITVDEIHKKQEKVIQAAAVCKAAGFVGVDLHSLHWGYLLDEFVLAITNHREDEYGGSLENRLRVVSEMVKGIHQVCGDTFPVTVGLGVKSFIKALGKASLHGEEEAGRTVEESVKIAKELEKMGIAAIMTDVGIYDSFYHACAPSYLPKGHALKYYEDITKSVGIPVIGRSRLGDPDLCESAVRDGIIDAVALGRPGLADPYFPRKIEMGIKEKIRPCIGCNVGCLARATENGQVAGCAVNPRTCREDSTRPRKAVRPRKIAVIGGGVAGMQAALTSAECGHRVELFEKRDRLGGEMLAAGAHAFKSEVNDLRRWFIRELEENHVPVHLSTQISAEEVKSKGFDTVILATGAESVMPKSIKGIEKAVTAVEASEGTKEIGKNVMVAGGGMIGVETAVGLAVDGHNVTILEAMPEIMEGKFVPKQHKMMLKDLIEYHNIDVITGHQLSEITDEGAVIVAVGKTAEAKLIPVDSIVMSIGMRPVRSLAPDYYGKNIAVYEIGAAQQAGDIYSSVHQAFEVAYHFD